ncbi:MAG: bifunctional diaminohydroxyphosphoribosylaminopyrimidine deaminase/5-amino-6-(5-phosphoribosylamino)uracil reductase RibD [Bacteroidales bacterium]|nr:bifunctional diaminohydroxyphosphoribosylaminopyrimidine deaminase/5-amino-6-(5-phosphoribosylamino)uracil reductase RibD [Bacteroidales bacterium]
MVSLIDRKYMERAIELASRATGNTRPNPLVGAVIVHEDKIIGEGYHTRPGEAHAEVKAIDTVKDKNLLKIATMYVNLEPCSHYGRTPPCAKRIIEEKIPRVVIGSTDPSLNVGGKGINMLIESGVEVKTGILANENRELNKRFFTYHEKRRPYIVLKWAQSADGYIDRLRLNNQTGPTWITGVEERMLVHKWRSEENAILIGDKTACNDDPALDVRLWRGTNPLRFVLSDSSNLPAGLKIFGGEPRTVIFSPNPSRASGQAEYISLTSRETALEEIMSFMYEAEIQSVIIEGGYEVLSQFIDAGLWDEARVFKGQVIFGTGLKAPVIKGKITLQRNFRESRLEYLRPLD